jgi:hypothetical protein
MKIGDTIRITRTFRSDRGVERIASNYLILKIERNILTVKTPLGLIANLNTLNFSQ